MGKNRGIAVMLGKHDIAINIMKKIGFFHIGIPGFGLKLRYIKPVFINLFTVPVSGNIHEKSPDVPSPADKVSYKKFHRRCRNKYISEILLW